MSLGSVDEKRHPAEYPNEGSWRKEEQVKQYKQLLMDIITCGIDKGDRTGTGTRSLFGYQMRFDLAEGFPLLTTKKLAFRWIAEELFWMLRGSTNEKELRAVGVDIWKEWATAEQCALFGRREGDLGPVYGKQFRSFGKWDPGSLQDVAIRVPSESSLHRQREEYTQGDGSYEVLGAEGHDKDGRPLVRIRFASGFERVQRRSAEKANHPRDPYAVSVAGVGYLGEYDRKNPLAKRLKKVWSHMLDRCYVKTCKEYAYYGADGVTVCRRWMSFAAFLEDAKTLPGYYQMMSDPTAYHLDKDHFGSSVYAPNTTLWLPRWANRSYVRWSPFEAISPDGKTYKHGSASMFARLHGLHGHSVARCLRGERPHHKGWTFRLLENSNLRYSAPVDQLRNVLDEILHNPNSRRIILTGWDPHEAENVALPPCHTMSQFYVAEGRLSCHMYQRSADVFLGVPYNIASYALLTHMLASVTDLKPGTFVHSFGDVHTYNNHKFQVAEQLQRELRPLPKLVVAQRVHRKGARVARSALEDLLAINYESLKLTGYNPHPSIKAPVAV